MIERKLARRAAPQQAQRIVLPRISRRAAARGLLRGLALLVITLVFTVPYLWMAASALRPRAEIFAHIHPLSWRTFIPQQITLDNFARLLVERQFGIALANSLGIALVTVVLALLVNSMIAFAFARLRFPGRELVFVVILATMLVPFEAIIVSMFLIVQRVGLYDTYAAILLPWVSDVFIIFLFRQHFRDLPAELHDAAVVDGCSPFRVYWSIMLPNIKPALISAAFIKFVWSWDGYVWPLIVTRDPNKAVVSVAIAQLFTDQNVLWELIFAGAFLATIPLVILFLFLQRYYVEGVVNSGLKG
jgi:ABC-type glycerol-3-phosphate transport system permease component